MTSHKDYRLDQLGIPSQYEADELERDLNVRFELFTYNDREVWVQQNVYLDAYAYNRTVSESADMAGVPVSIAQNWKYFNTLGFKRRLEIADLRFSDSLQVLALERVREPDAPASLLITLLRAHIPEKFSTNGHVCDTSKADELLSLYSQDAQRELEAGHPGLRAIADGTYQPRSRSRSHDDPSYTNPPSADAAPNPADGPSAPPADAASNPAHDPYAPPVGAGFKPAHDPYAPSTPSAENPPTPSPVLGEDGGEGKNSPSASSALSAVNPPHPSVRPEPVEGQLPAPTLHTGERGNPQDAHPDSIESDHDTSSSHEAPFPLPDDDIQPVDPDEVAYFNLPPSEREDASHPNSSPTDTASASAASNPAHDLSAPPVGAGFKPAHDPSASSAPSAVNPPAPNRPRRPFATLFQRTRPNPNDDHDTFPVKRF